MAAWNRRSRVPLKPRALLLLRTQLLAMQTAGQKRVRASPTLEEEDLQQHRVLQSWFRLMRRFLLVLMPLQQMLERFMDHMLSTKPHREALKEMIRALPDEDLPMIQNVARQEMNRREDTGHRPQEQGHWSNLSETSTHPARRPRPPPDPVLTERCRQINSLPGIEMILEPRPRCHCALQCKIHLSDSGPTGHNYEKLYFRCPLELGHQCRFVQWCEQQPLLSLESWRHRQQPGDEPVSYTQILEAMIQTKCQHKETHRKGSNAYLTKVTCRTCNKVIKSEKIGKTEEGNKSKASTTSSSSAPPSRQGIPSPATPQTTSDGTDLEHLTDYQEFQEYLRWKNQRQPPRREEQ